MVRVSQVRPVKRGFMTTLSILSIIDVDINNDAEA